MGLNDLFAQGYQPKENQEFGDRKKLIGDAVCQLKLESKVAKTGKKWYILKAEAIHVIPDAKGRETTLEPGDSIDKLYDPEDNESLSELVDDLFTSGISFQNGPTEEMTLENMIKAAEGKLAYYRTWAKDKPKDKLVEGKPNYYQNIKILSHTKITAENSTPQIAF